MELRQIQQPADLAGATHAAPPNATRVLPAATGGVVQLPPGTRLDAIKLSGNDLLVTLPDGQILLIVDGALQIPQLKIGPINIPAPTIAALIAAQEPEPAAGAPQSSGGNFEQTPGGIGDPFGLGDLLPPTDFSLPGREASELIPDAIDDEPEILISTPDQPAGATSATATVAEAALPARGAEPAGSDAASPGESISGTIQISALDQPSVLTVAGTVVTAVGQTIATPLGQITITSIEAGLIGYTYTLTDNATDPDATDVVTITVTDNDGDVATATLTLTVTDDAPAARADTDTLSEGTAHGNVITGADTTSGSAGADTPGADGATVTGIRSGTGSVFAPAGVTINGEYGRLLIAPDGNYVYIRSAGSPGGVTDVFTYQITDGDGDTATATLSIEIADDTPSLAVPSAGDDGTFVDEAGLPERPGEAPGSRAGDDSNATVGVIPYSAVDGPAVITINGVEITGAEQEITLETGILHIIAINPDSIEYAFVLTDNVVGDPASQPVTITITDVDGDTASASFEIDILDDFPTAQDDSDSLTAGLDAEATGNVVTDAENDGGRDTEGADGATVTAISSEGESGEVGGITAGAYGTLEIASDGSYTYVLDPENPAVQGLDGDDELIETFEYVLTDGDGDAVTATLSITIRGRDDIVTISGLVPDGAEATVDEANLADGSNPDGEALIRTGSFSFDAADGVAAISIGGEILFDGTVAAGLTIVTELGILTITDFVPAYDDAGDIVGGTIAYSYELAENSLLHDGVTDTALTESFAIEIVDSDGTSAASSLDIQILDDNPLAEADAADAGEGQTLEVDAAGGLLANDVAGADGVEIAGVRAAAGNGTAPATGGVGAVITGLYGELTLAADGSYVYAAYPNAVAPEGAEDVFVYTLVDGDGDLSTTTLTIHLADSGLSADPVALQVEEAGLPTGSDPASDTESIAGDLNDGVAGGNGPYEFALSGDGVGTHGTFTLNADGSYVYVLTSAIDGVTANNGANLVPVVETFTYIVTDAFGNATENVITIDVVDDVPTARSAPSITVAEDAPPISGNLLANDTAGADGATVTSVTIGGVVVAVAATGTTSFSNANGSYTFQPGGAWTFDPVVKTHPFVVNADFTYVITDGDGDQSSAVQQIRLADGADPTAGDPVALTLDDQHLETGSTPSGEQPVAASGQIVFTQGSDAIVSIGFGDLSTLDGGLSWTLESDTQIIGWDADENPVIVIDLSVSGHVATVTATLQYNYGLHPDTTIDDIADLGAIDIVATDADGDTAAGTVNLSVSDDVPSISGHGSPAALLIVDETNLAANATASFASLFDIVIGADMAGSSVNYQFDVTRASGLIDTATGQKIVLQALGNVVEGRLQDSPSIVAFRLSVASDGTATLDQMRAVRHSDTTSPDDSITLSSTLIRLTATVTDGDGDQASTMILVGNALVFKDDGPSIDATNIDADNIILTTQDADTRGDAFDVATADLSGAFSVAAMHFGADGPGGTGAASWTYSLALGSAAATSALTSNGVPVTLALVSGEIVGSAGGTPIFSIAVDAATGVVTLTQFAEIDHPLPGSPGNYEAQLVTLAADLVELRGTATIVDGDGDSISDTVAIDLGGNIRFADDGPSISGGGPAPVLVVDESNFAANASANLAGLFAQTTDFGADGPGSIAYELGVTAGASGLIDALTRQAVLLSIEGGIVYGRTATHEVFRISVAANGTVTFDQSRAVIHNPDSGPDQILFLAGSNLVTLTAIVTDGDGDTARTTADITGHFAIRDDAPVAVDDADNVSRDGEIFADGNVLTGTGGTDINGMDGSADGAGSDGGLSVVGVAFGATAGTPGASLAGDYGSIIVAADGSYRYDLDPDDPAVIALNANETLTDTFHYVVRDADGDTSTATITISITGTNDFPVARADTNWVLDGPSGSDPSASGNVLLDIAHPGAPFGSFADVADNDPDLEAISVTSAGTYVGLYGTLEIAADGSYTYVLDEDKAAVDALDAGQTLVDSFAYTISDGALSVGSMLSITIFGTNDAPTIGTAIARLSEEGLPGGIADNAPNATLDTTNSTTIGGMLAIADADAGETLTATLGNPGAVLTAGGVPVTWSGAGTGTLVGSVGGSEVIRVTLAPSGAYTVTLSRAVDHPTIALEDLKSFSVPVSVSDGTVTTTNAAAIQIVIEDDAPTALGETGSSAQIQQDVNTLFILDFSDSIDASELDTMIGAVQGALTQLDNAAASGLTIRFVIFSSGSFASPSFSSAAAANAYLSSLNPADGGERPSQDLPPDGIGLNTNYSGAIQTALANFTPVPGASNQVFFLSDGNPNQQIQFGGVPISVINSLTAPTAAAWNNFVDSNNINVTAIGIDNDPLQPLNIQRLRDVDLNDAPNNNPILVDDFQDLVATLLSVIVPAAVAGDLDANDAFGADGGRLLSITIGSTTYIWDGASSIAVSTGGTIAGTTLNAITTPMGGTLTLDFASGQYNYQPPTPITITATEVFAYVVTDRDGDTATANLSVTITALAPPIAVDLDGDGVEFLPGAAGVHFDYGGDGEAESTAWVAADDGLLAIDSNGDNKVDGPELVFARDGLTDLQGLAADYDSNGDGRLDAADTDFAKFGIWQDANGNGVTDAGEFRSLIDAGIVSISLLSDGKPYTAANGDVHVRGEASFTRADGSTGKIADAAFATHFATEQQRAAAAGTTGVSTAMLVAGLAAATPLAAQPGEASLADSSAMAAAAIEPSASAPVPAAIHPSERAGLLIHEFSSGPAIERVAADAHHVIDPGDGGRADTSAAGLEVPADRVQAALPAQTEVDTST
ncbi:MAG: hypothetical protein C0520_00960, partial [Sphingopyxis sp.]|nr:hypothetical protein [Sphingopyxis sp.]